MASSNNKALAQYKNAITTATSVVAAVMLVSKVVIDIFPDTTLGALLLPAASTRHTVLIDEFDGVFYNRVFLAAKAYVSALLADAPVPRIKASLPRGTEHILLTMRAGTEVADLFDGAEFIWRLTRLGGDKRQEDKRRNVFELSFDKKHKDMVLHSYLPFVMGRAEAMAHEQKQVKLYSNEWGKWRPVKLRNASTFATLAMDVELRASVVDDLERFLSRKEYYKRTGRAWKRGYLIYGPPGTGKSSLVAAMSNYLHFDVYDLELGAVRSNTGLRKLLLRMKNRSILLIEDVDCAAAALPQREADGGSGGERNPAPGNHTVTLSGLLNMVDGLWSASGQERILVFTTNHKDRLDPALLRPGRMDMHIHMGYCGFGAFKELAFNYHEINEHPLFPEIEELLQLVEVAPADVAGKLLRSDDTDVALQILVEFLKVKEKGGGEDSVGDMSYIKQKLHMGQVKWLNDRPKRSNRPTPVPSRGGRSSTRGRTVGMTASRGRGRGSGEPGRGRRGYCIISIKL